MRVKIEITDDDGHAFEGEVDLLKKTDADRSRKSVKQRSKRTSASTQTSGSVNFNLPIRAFINKNANGMAGAEKFTLLLAHMAKGKINSEVTVKDLKKSWGKMEGLLGEFNSAHPVRAKDNGWVDSPKVGTYVLLSDWKQIF